MKEVEKNKKPDVREKALEHGLSYMFDEELIMMILGSGSRQHPVESLAEKITEVLDQAQGGDVIEKPCRVVIQDRVHITILGLHG